MTNFNLIQAVIDIDDVEYLIDENAAILIERGETDIGILRLVDKAIVIFPRQQILSSIEEKGIIDRL